MMAMRSAARRAGASMADVELDDVAPDPEAPSPVGDRAIRSLGWALVALFSCVATVVAVAAGGSGYPIPPPVPGLVGAFGSAVSPAPEDRLAARDLERLPKQTGSPLEPGRYLAIVGGGPHPLVPVLTVPDGFRAVGEFGVLAGSFTEGRLVWVWDIAGVYTHPCDAGNVPEIVGPSVADLASALAAQPLRDGTPPVPVSIDGYRGLYVELSVPDGIDINACFDGQFDSWTEGADNDASWRWLQEPGQIDMLWILDVDGDRITIAAAHGPAASQESVEELERIVTTARFVPVDMT